MVDQYDWMLYVSWEMEKCNVEVQRSDNDNHVRRVRFNASSIALKDSQKNEKFEQIEDIIVVYISQFDIFKA